MGEQVITSIVAILTAIIGVAIIAVVLSNKAQTTGVIGAAGSAFSNALGTALSPVTGGSTGGGGGFLPLSIH